jgi:oxygen-dependent protoporphyrinogen oxidase
VRMGLDLVLPRGEDVGDESLGDFVRRRLGREALAKIAEPIVAGIHAGDPEEMSVRATFPMFHEMERRHRSLIVGMLARRRARARAAAETGAAAAAASSGATAAPARPRLSYFYSFTTGLADLSDAIVASLPGERLATGVAAESLAAVGSGAAADDERPAGGNAAGPGGRYVLGLTGGRRESVDAIVLAAPAYASGELLRGVAPAAAADLSSIAYVTTATVSLGYRREPVGHPLRGFGLVVPRVEGRGLMAVTWSSSKFPGRAPDGQVLLRCFLGRAGREEEAQLDDVEMLRLVRRELTAVMGITAEPVLTEIFRWPLGMPQYRVGHAALVGRIEEALAGIPGVELAGAYHGIGIGDCLREGAAAAGRSLAYLSGLSGGAQAAPPPEELPAGDGIED